MQFASGSVEPCYVSRVPHFNSVLNFLDTEAATETLQSFVDLSAAPLAGIERSFAVDSTGFAGASHVRWFDEKYGRPREEVRWVKLHAMVGVTTNVVVSCKVMEKSSADATQFPELVADAAERFQVDEVSADKAYTSGKNFSATDAIGARFYPAFKKNATGQAGGSYEKAFLLMKLNEEAYAEKYHKRSNVEATFSAIKRLFGPSLRSKNELAMRNEALAKVVCFNLTCVIHAMYELGIDTEFVLKPRCTTNGSAAHQITQG
jgi:transposase